MDGGAFGQTVTVDAEKNAAPLYRAHSGAGSVKTVRDSTHRKLKPRHIQLIGIGGTIGTALYVQIGKGLMNGGPGSLFLAFSLWYVRVCGHVDGWDLWIGVGKLTGRIGALLFLPLRYVSFFFPRCDIAQARLLETLECPMRQSSLVAGLIRDRRHGGNGVVSAHLESVHPVCRPLC